MIRQVIWLIRALLYKRPVWMMFLDLGLAISGSFLEICFVVWGLLKQRVLDLLVMFYGVGGIYTLVL